MDAISGEGRSGNGSSWGVSYSKTSRDGSLSGISMWMSNSWCSISVVSDSWSGISVMSNWSGISMVSDGGGVSVVGYWSGIGMMGQWSGISVVGISDRSSGNGSIVGDADVGFTNGRVGRIDGLQRYGVHDIHILMQFPYLSLFGDGTESSKSSDGVFRLSSKSQSSVKVSRSDGCGSSDNSAEDDGLLQLFQFRDWLQGFMPLRITDLP